MQQKIAVFVVAAMCMSAALQAESAQSYVLTAYSDAVGGSQLLSGQYSAALVQIRDARGSSVSPDLVKETNACVAFAMLRRLDEAHAACDAAVTAATADRSHAGGVVSKSRLQENAAVAIAFSNRAIVHALSNEAVGSAEDLADAHSLSPQSEVVVRNIAAFRQLPGSSAKLAVAARHVAD
jgi:hypothetical protein